MIIGEYWTHEYSSADGDGDVIFDVMNWALVGCLGFHSSQQWDHLTKLWITIPRNPYRFKPLYSLIINVQTPSQPA